MNDGKIVSAAEAVGLIRSGNTVATGGFVGIGFDRRPPAEDVDARIFGSEPMGLRAELLEVPFDARFKYDPDRNTLFINFERFEVHSLETIEAIRRKVAEISAPLHRRIRAVVNYEGFVLGREVEDAWSDMVSEVVDRWYDGVTRYTTSAFLRAKLGDALARRKLAPHIFESEEEALAALPKP